MSRLRLCAMAVVCLMAGSLAGCDPMLEGPRVENRCDFAVVANVSRIPSSEQANRDGLDVAGETIPPGESAEFDIMTFDDPGYVALRKDPGHWLGIDVPFSLAASGPTVVTISGATCQLLEASS